MKDKNGNQIIVGHELNVPLDVFSTGVVVHNEKKELSLELRYENKKVPLKEIVHILECVEIF